MTCRAATSAVNYAGNSPTGAALGYDNEHRMTSWQIAPSSPGATAGACPGRRGAACRPTGDGGQSQDGHLLHRRRGRASAIGGRLSFLAGDGKATTLPAAMPTALPATSGGSPSVA